MDRRTFLIALGAAGVAGPVAADPLTDGIVAQLRRQGYGRIAVSRTLLGRVRIVGNSSSRRREIIVNPRTGEILRDYWLDETGGSTGVTILEDDEGPRDDRDEAADGDDQDGGGDDEGGDDQGGDDDGDDDGGDDDDDQGEDADHGGDDDDDDDDDQGDDDDDDGGNDDSGNEGDDDDDGGKSGD
jgi:hypothetical protein